MKAFAWLAPLLALLLAAPLQGCATQRFRDAADREVYEILKAKEDHVPGTVEDFDLDAHEGYQPLEGLETILVDEPSLGDDPAEQSYIVTLEKALSIAFKNSRSYQNEKESLYLEALGLTLERHQFTPIFSGSISGEYEHSTVDEFRPTPLFTGLDQADTLVRQLEGLTGSPADLFNAYSAVVREAGILGELDEPELHIVSEDSVNFDTAFGVDYLMKGGGRIALALTSNFLQFLTGDNFTGAGSLLTASFTQPLLRGAGSEVAAEQLTQAERDVLYALREFTRFRKVFAVQVASSYYSVLQDRDVVANNYESYTSFQRSVERERAWAEEGRSTQADLGRLLQAELSNRNAWINSVRRYKENLDEFKILLGLPTDVPLALSNKELEVLREHGLQHPEVPVESAIDVALMARLDFYTSRDRAEDSARRVEVAANQLWPDLDLVLTGSAGNAGEDDWLDLDFDRARWNAGLDFDFPWNRKRERNNFRSTLISHERSLRDFTLAKDNVILDVRSAWRNLDQARMNYEVAVASVELNERRVEEQDLRAELGLATAIDQVDAQNALTEAQNDLTSAIVSHTLAKLAFWRDMGILYIKENGQWEEVKDGSEIS